MGSVTLPPPILGPGQTRQIHLHLAQKLSQIQPTLYPSNSGIMAVPMSVLQTVTMVTDQRRTYVRTSEEERFQSTPVRRLLTYTQRERWNESSTVQRCAHTKAYKCTVINDHISKHVWTKGCSCSLHLPVIPAQLMRPGIGQNTSCAVGNFG